MLLNPIEIAKSASSGAWSFNTMKFSGGDLRQILVSAATATTTFDLSLTDDYGNIVLSIEGITGTYGADPSELMYLPLRGVYTVSVANSSADEAYTGRILVEV